jgi:D-alanyl-D-alanine carboxypeptidase (penicillin-binding protein 5/6)
MGAPSRALGALTLTAAILLPALPATGQPAQDPAPSGTASATVTTPSGAKAEVLLMPSGQVPAPPVAADSWVVADLDSGAILGSQNADLAVRPASTLKLLTALTVVPRLSPDQPYRATRADEENEGNRVVLHEGLEYTVNDLLHAALLPSANDAADALARANGGIESTVGQMNAEAQRLGATGTTARNPSGLDADGQVTTARDMALIGRAALANPEIAAALLRPEIDFPGKVENGERVIYPIYNHNRTVAYDRFDGYLGGKSGYTSQAGNTLVAGAERDGRRLLVTLFHIGGNTYRSGEALLEWGFANASRLQPVGSLPEPTAAAPQFARAVTPLPAEGQPAASRDAAGGGPAAPREAAVVVAASDAPTATTGASRWDLPSPSLPSPLTILTVLVGLVALLRARVYWIGHRHRTAWVSLDDWAAAQAGSARRRAPVDRQVRPGTPTSRRRAEVDESLVGTRG